MRPRPVDEALFVERLQFIVVTFANSGLRINANLARTRPAIDV